MVYAMARSVQYGRLSASNGSMTRTAVQAEHLAARTRDILARITHALPDWSAEQLDVLASQMAELEVRCAAREAARNGLWRK
jgi:hypothetical protein